MQLFINNWSAVLTAPATVSAAQLSIDPAQAAKLVGLGSGDYYMLTLALVDASGAEAEWEIVKVTAVSSGEITVARGQEASAARGWAPDSKISARATAGSLDGLRGGGASSPAGSVVVIGSDYPAGAPPSIGANYFFNDAIFTAIGTEHPEQWVQVSGPPNGHSASVSAGYPSALNISRLDRTAWLNASGAANAILPTTEISFPQWMAAPTGFFLKVTPATDGLLVKANLNFWVGWSAIVFRAGGLDLFSPVATGRVVSIAVSTTVIIRFEFEIFEDDGSYGLGVIMSAEAAPRISEI